MHSRDDSGTVKYLVVDYQSCTFTLNGKRSDMLSQPLIKFAKQGGYDGFYGSTLRAHAFTKPHESAVKNLAQTTYTRQQLDANFPLTAITANFEKAVGLPAVAVLTLDGCKYHEIGMAYECVVKPFEMNGIEPSPHTFLTTAQVYQVLKDGKKPQLLKIARHAAAQHPGEKVELDFVDDSKTACNKVSELAAELPTNVRMHAYHHVANKQGPVTAVYTAPPFPASPEPSRRAQTTTACKAKLFSKSQQQHQRTHAMETRSMARVRRAAERADKRPRPY